MSCENCGEMLTEDNYLGNYSEDEILCEACS